MVSQTVNFDRGQYQYIVATMSDGDNVSERVRELVDKGMKVEQNE